MDPRTEMDLDYYTRDAGPLGLAQFTNHDIFGSDSMATGVFSRSSSNDPIDPLLFMPGDLDVQRFHEDLSASPQPTLESRGFFHDASFSKHNGVGRADSVMDMSPDRKATKSSSSEEKDPTPAQTRRKAQNRAAQRAFRERKERHVRELEDQLSSMNAKTSSLQSDVDRLKLLLQRAQTENKILKASTSKSPGSPSHVSSSSTSDFNHGSAPLMFTKTNNEDESPGSREASVSSASVSSTSSRYLGPGETWDLLQAHPLFLRGDVDVGQVCDKLKWLARCEASTGPVFDETEVRQVIEEVARGSHDFAD